MKNPYQHLLNFWLEHWREFHYIWVVKKLRGKNSWLCILWFESVELSNAVQDLTSVGPASLPSWQRDVNIFLMYSQRYTFSGTIQKKWREKKTKKHLRLGRLMCSEENTTLKTKTHSGHESIGEQWWESILSIKSDFTRERPVMTQKLWDALCYVFRLVQTCAYTVANWWWSVQTRLGDNLQLMNAFFLF